MKTKFCILLLILFSMQIFAQKSMASDSISRKKLMAVKKEQNNVPMINNFSLRISYFLLKGYI
ncbi:hypothetical protein [Epilithonimonas hispanica]|uniref:hypothetical protein n=1 Tax=Epilithonimonas hispanica TaxID=358687 RepID=UPI000F4F1482|nr:hypothetical protein [Epilithonimonas hispanica]